MKNTVCRPSLLSLPPVMSPAERIEFTLKELPLQGVRPALGALEDGYYVSASRCKGVRILHFLRDCCMSQVSIISVSSLW